jgi:Leucine-rich repeat (LRR) protein
MKASSPPVSPTPSKSRLSFIASNNLVGSLPKEIGALTDLENVLFGFNALSSSLPSSLFELGKLAIVDFSTNKLSGTIPDSLSQATLLHTLHLGNNQLEGPISLDVFGGNSACPLELLVLAENKFTGTFPFESIGMNCSSLHSLNLESSGFAAGGTFPTTGLEQLTVLDLRQMGLGGTIPDSISRLSLLKKLELDFNDFRGPIPEIIGQLTTLTELSLSNNRLEGAIPPILGQLQQLTILDLRTNLFSGTLPTELALLPNLERAHFESNFLSGDMEMFCPRDTTGTSRLTILSSDCSFDGIVCSCCTECF